MLYHEAEARSFLLLNCHLSIIIIARMSKLFIRTTPQPLILLFFAVPVSMAGGTVPWITAQSMVVCQLGVLGAPARCPVVVLD